MCVLHDDLVSHAKTVMGGGDGGGGESSFSSARNVWASFRSEISWAGSDAATWQPWLMIRAPRWGELNKGRSKTAQNEVLDCTL